MVAAALEGKGYLGLRGEPSAGLAGDNPNFERSGREPTVTFSDGDQHYLHCSTWGLTTGAVLKIFTAFDFMQYLQQVERLASRERELLPG